MIGFKLEPKLPKMVFSWLGSLRRFADRALLLIKRMSSGSALCDYLGAVRCNQNVGSQIL